MITYREGLTLTDTLKARSLLNTLTNYYPEFEYWYVNKCMPDILLKRNTLLLAEEHGQLVGVGIGKKNKEETKLRCIRVHPDYQSKGIGIHLVEKMLVLLDHDKPHCTVAEEMLHDFSRPFVNYFNFNLKEVKKGMYRQGKLEYIFN